MAAYASLKEQVLSSAPQPSSRFAKEQAESVRGENFQPLQDLYSSLKAPGLCSLRVFRTMGKVTGHMEGLDGLHAFAPHLSAGDARVSSRKTFQELLCTLGDYINGVSSRRHSHHKSRLAAALHPCTLSRFDECQRHELDQEMETEFDEQNDALLPSPQPQTPSKRSQAAFLSEITRWDLSPGPSSQTLLWNSPRDEPLASVNYPLGPTSPNTPKPPRRSLFKSNGVPPVNVEYGFGAENIAVEGGLVSPGQFVASQFKGLNLDQGQRKRVRRT